MADYDFAIFAADNFINPGNPGHLPIEDATHSSELSIGDTMTWLGGGTSTVVTVTDNANANFDEAHSNQTLKNSVTFNGNSYASGQIVTPSYILDFTGSDGQSYSLMSFNFTPNSAFQEPHAAVWVSNAPPAGTVLTVNGERNPTGSAVPQFTDLITCFTRGMSFSSRQGPCLIEHLDPGDLILTDAGTYKPILWIGSRRISGSSLAANPKLRPVRITSGSLGDGLPVRDLLVSRQHRMLIRSGIAERMFGVPEVLVPAIKLTALPGIYVDDAVEEVEYFHILLEQHEVIIAEGCATESLFTGSHALASLATEAREEILTIFPELADIDYQPELARVVPAGKQQKRLIERHLKNNKPLQQAPQQHFASH